MQEANEASKDVAKFYNFVMREEKTQDRIIATPHQLVMFSFADYHPYCVIRIPVGCGKTYFICSKALYNLGRNRSRRSAIMSASAPQAKKPLGMVADYIVDENLNDRLALVFPDLRPSPRPQDPWTTEQITVDRPPGIRDASMIAVGLETRISGSRISDAVADDVVDDQNTYNPSVRANANSKFNSRLVSRMDPADSSLVVCNTPFHREDLTYHLENKEHWPTITMDIYGFVRWSNANAAWIAMALERHLRPSTTRGGGAYDWYRLKAYDPDPEELTPLWPERYPYKWIQEKRYGKNGKGGMLPVEFARAFLCDPMSEDAARCQLEWIEKCKLQGMQYGAQYPLQYDGPNPTYTGVDIGVGRSSAHDKSTLFTIEKRPDGMRRILDIDSGRFTGRDIIGKIIEKTERFDSSVTVENNSAQDFIIQFAKETKKDLNVKGLTTTGASKRNENWGVESIFSEIQNGAWIIPCDRDGRVAKNTQAWIDDCIYYQPMAHSGDYLMASWFAREASRKRSSSTTTSWKGKTRALSSTGSF
jgi:hypothetical protein